MDERIFLGETGEEKILSGTFVQAAVGTATLTQPARPRHLATLYLTNASELLLRGLSARWLLFIYEFFRGFNFCCLGIPRSTYFSFFLFKSVSHFGIMQANPSQCDGGLMIIDRSRTQLTIENAIEE